MPQEGDTMTARPELALHQMTVYGTKDMLKNITQQPTEDAVANYPSVGHCLNERIDEFTEEVSSCGDCRNCEAWDTTMSLLDITPIRKVRKDKKQR